jgi:hypothetical protein
MGLNAFLKRVGANGSCEMMGGHAIHIDDDTEVMPPVSTITS